MNLPAMSIEFLPSLSNLYDHDESERIQNVLIQNNKEIVGENEFKFNGLQVFVYHFVKTDEIEKVKASIKNNIFKDSSLEITSRFVRKVAPCKDMFCSMFKLELTKHLLTLHRNDSVKKRENNEEEEEDDDNVQSSSKISRKN
jgi:hypothetical protein